MFRQWIENAGPARYSGSGDLTDLWGLIRCKSNRLVGLSQALTQRGYRSIGYSFGAARERIALGATDALALIRKIWVKAIGGVQAAHH